MVKTLFKFARDELLLPLLKRPRRLQVAALCVRTKPRGPEVLLITSRGTKRWILPKGWPEKGHDAAGTALLEAWEEAGVKRATVSPEPIGRYTSTKNNDSGLVEPCDMLVFRLDVHEMTSNFPEQGERQLNWVSPEKAAEMVSEPELKAILRALPRA